MLKRTFQLIRGVGPSREKDLWAEGIRTWDHFPTDPANVALSARQDDSAREQIRVARAALASRDLGALGQLIPQREHWRLYAEFQRDAVFFDIEADGRERMAPTVVSLFHRDGFEVFIQGRNLDALPDALARWPLWITFNGSVFDVPVLRNYFGPFPTPQLHLDLRFACRRLGLPGGLKRLEDRLGFGRPPHLRGVDGFDAVLLWRAFRETADMEALRFLVEYNLYDSIQLRTLVERAYNHGIESLGLDAAPLQVFERGDVLYDVSRYLLELGPAPDELKLLERIRRRDRDISQE